MTKMLASYWRFLLAGLFKQAQTGAVVPSQRFLIRKMIAPIPPDYRGQILELGAGTGALTRRLALRCPEARILACEINPLLAQDLEASLAAAGLDGRVQVVSDAAEHLLAGMARKGTSRPDFILSGIPLGNLDREAVLVLVGGIRRALAPGGLYIQFQHSLIDRKKIKNTFSRLRTVPVFLNFPPAVIYYALR
jgi:phospholipid N-methyltransferase